MPTRHNVKTRQHGAVLIVSLLILLVLTLIGVSSLDGSIMEEKMASNSQIATITFQKAESSIREAFFIERIQPSKAVDKKRGDDPFIERNETVDGITIISTTRHIYNPDADGITMQNSSNNIFEARAFEIAGTAQVGNIISTNIQGYLVLNQMRRP